MTRKTSLLASLLGIFSPLTATAEVTFKKGDRIAFIGNALADRMQHEGHLESLIHARFPDHDLVFRNLGFSGDTISKRPREPEFGSPEEWLKRARANIVFAFFGYGESLRGPDGVDGFKKEVAGLIDKTQGANFGHGPVSIVLFSPIAREDIGSPYLPDIAEGNATLALYTAAMGDVAAEKGVPFVDLFTPSKKLFEEGDRQLTINGIHLNSEGSRWVAAAAEKGLFGNAQDRKLDMEKLRGAVVDKNLHWWSYYRTVDGYNVYGGRSRLNWHGQSNADVMAVEMKTFQVMADNRDKAVWAAARGSQHEVKDDNFPKQLVVKSNRKGPNEDGSFPYLGGEEAIGKMEIHEGMKVNLFASEERFEDLINPVQLAVDTDSNLWVATWHSYPHWNPNEPMRDKLMVLPDEDGDGVADRAITFADNLNSVTGFEFWGGGVLVAALPELLFMKDTDGDYKADVKIRMLNGLSSSDTHHSANAMVVGPDGGVYWSRGIFNVCNMETPTKTFSTGSSGVYRFDPRTYEIDFHFPIGPNPHGDVFDAWGYQFATDGTSGTGSYIAIGKGKGMYRQWYQKRVRPVPATGFLSGTHFPPEHDGNFLICNAIGFLGVLQHEVKYNGAEITAEEIAPIVVSKDPNFRPSDVEMGGDGALYISDWCNALIGHMQHNMRDPNRDHKHGRIYRVTHEGRALQKPVKMRGKPIAEVLGNFKHADQAVRYRTRLELSGRDPKEACAAATKFAASLNMADSTDAMAALNCLWVHSEARIPNLSLAETVMAAEESRVRAAGARVLGWWGDPTRKLAGERPPEDQLLALLQRAARDKEPLVRAEAVVAAANFEPSAEAAEVIFEVGTRPLDPHIEYVLNYANGELKVNNIASETLKGGGELSQAGRRYLLRTADNATLLKMERDEAVNREILARPGIGAIDRATALRAVAADSGKPAGRLLLELIAEAPDAMITEYAALFPRLSKAEVSAASKEMQALAKAKKNLGLQSAVVAAAANSGVAPHFDPNHRETSLEDIEVFLGAVPQIDNAAVRIALYPRVRSLAFGLPNHLTGASAAVSSAPGVQFDYYERNDFPNCKLETVNSWTPTRSGSVETLTHNIPDRRPDKFAVKLSTWVSIPASGKWEFGIASDDGSRLYLDGKLLIDNDGNHGLAEKRASVELTAGAHQLVTTYFDSGGGDGFGVNWQGPGVKRGPIPKEALGGVAGGPSRSAAELLAGLGAPAKAVFDDMLALLGKNQHADLAIAHIAEFESLPKDKLPTLATALAASIPQTPIELRDGEAFKTALALAKKVAAAAPAKEAAALKEATADLDLAVVTIRSIPETLLYDRKQFTVRAGKPVKIIFENPDAVQHNLMVIKPGSLEEVGKLSDAMATDPDGFKKGFIPDTDKILHSTKLLNKDESATLSFIAPKEPGDYPFVCTFPGHWRLMNGVMVVR